MEENTSRHKMTFEQLVEKSRDFFRNNKGCKIRTSANLIENLPKHYSKTIEKFANEAYPIIHQDVVGLIQNFLDFKKRKGSAIEKELYAEMTLVQFIDRLVRKRPLAFLTAADSWLTKDGDYGAGGWDEIGTDKQGTTYKVLTLDKFLSYDEVKIAALLQLSAPVVTINNGSRDNVGRPGDQGSYIDTAVYVGAVGARFEMNGRMEYQDMLVTEEQNTASNGYGAEGEESIQTVFAKFYGLSNLPTFTEATKMKTIHEKTDICGTDLLNTEIYTKRIQISAETFLLEADRRGKDDGREVYCHVVGLGLGVWQVSAEQNKYFLRAWEQAIQSTKLTSVKDINFSWIAKNKAVKNLQDGAVFNGIKIHFSRRNPFDLLPADDKEKLVVAMFAWDGNSYVGNEYWQGHLSASGDPAAAACSTIPELLNPDINTNVCGDNVMIATREHGLVTLEKYLK